MPFITNTQNYMNYFTILHQKFNIFSVCFSVFMHFYQFLLIFISFFMYFFIHYAQQNARIILHCILGFLFCNSDLFRKRKYMPSILRIIRHITYQFLPSIFPFKTDYTIFCRQQFSICHAFLKWYKNATF